MERKFIDLDLPSGTLWAEKNEKGFFTSPEAEEKFKGCLPSSEDYEELLNECTWDWDNSQEGMRVRGKNGNEIFFPALGNISPEDSKPDGKGWCGSYLALKISDREKSLWPHLWWEMDEDDYPLYLDIVKSFKEDRIKRSVRLIKR